ncbi:DNA cytosine methyltransferase [Rhizobium sp. WW_1]|jgi:DNA (cytosine-5)-methyltransferase 1|uniref:DNA cytosine methyltransferase n=1 Tax=Rhizobium sp. WW_1 TaxID=1907375 RepID=UPI00068FC716|nr:DNA cytosine methyltransferase [Rhizobium sp. WW_1]RKD61540.1 DNA (cytosine-5)-methyltransferase 1 [Rhizobium sp. WW_1]
MTKHFKPPAIPHSFGLDNRMTVVLFAGMGGGCDGLEQAGFHVHLAINHDPVAIAVHEKRHPHTKHLRCDVFEVDPRHATQGRGVRVLHASPDCTHFSVAKGGKPVSKRRRSLAWVVCRWAGTVRPETITLENVPEIQTWGGLIAKRCPKTGRVMRLDGSVAAKGERVPVQEQWLIPDPKKKGRIWRAWLNHMQRLGYNFEGKVLVCADYGIHTIRKRYFGVAQSDGSAIIWPARTHAPRKLARKLGLRPWLGIHEKIDWSIPVKSIFNRKKPLADATMRRTARGVMRYVIDAAKPFIVPITHTKGWGNPRTVNDPLCALTTAKGGELMIAVPSITKFRTGSVGADILDPLPAFTANGFHIRPGCAVPLGIMSASLQRQFGESDGVDIEEPAPAFTAGGQGHTALVSAFLAQHNDGPRVGLSARSAEEPVSALTTSGSQQGIVAASMLSLRGTNKHGRDATEPGATVMAGGNHAGLILAFLQAYYSGNGGYEQGLSDPIGAMTQKARHGLVTVNVRGHDYVITDIGMRMLEPEEGAGSHGFPTGCFPETIFVDGKERRLTKTEKYHLVGNSVPPRMVQLLAECNVRREFAEAAE